MAAIQPPSFMNSIPSKDDGIDAQIGQRSRDSRKFSSRSSSISTILEPHCGGGWKARPFDLYLTDTAAMIIFGPMLVIVGICFICWLLFTLAVFALPFFVGLTLAVWAFHSGAGVLGGILLGLFAGGATFGIGQFALDLAPWPWLRLLIILLFVAPAVIAGYSATFGIAHMAMSSAVWQAIFAVIGAAAVGVTAFVRLTGMATPELSGQGLVRS